MTEKSPEVEETAPADKQDPIDLLLNAPLYKEITANDELLRDLRKDGVIFDCFCVGCNRDSTFKSLEYTKTKVPQSISSSVRTGTAAPPTFMLFGDFKVAALCQRNSRHVYRFYFQLSGDRNLTKIGQWPSLEDIAGSDLSELRPVLSSQRYRELKRATGLASHGVGIGAFVYLRRIFEDLISEHHEVLARDGSPVEGFESLKMDQKVEKLADVLPAVLVENRAAYRILSTGIHELDEDTCKNYFPVIRQAIIVILRDDLRQRMEKEEAKALKYEMGRIVGELNRDR